MKIEGMDAVLRTSVNGVNNQARVDVPVDASDESVQAQDKVSNAFIEKAVEKANKTMQIQGRALEFRIHEKTKEIMVRVVDAETKEVIREIPPEKILDMFASMLEQAGLLVDERR